MLTKLCFSFLATQRNIDTINALLSAYVTNVKNSSRIYQDFYRNGPSHRSGADVTFKDIQRMFGFKTIEIGRWVKPEEQQIAANLFFDALCDLADILEVPEPVISLNGSLSLAFGKGGQKYASAHYNAAKRQLALAKNAGGGALAHEWFHAFDHYIAKKVCRKAKPMTFSTQLWLDGAECVEHPLANKLFSIYKRLFLNASGPKPSDYMQRSIAIDRELSIYYFAQPAEAAARAFEAYIQDQYIKNHFLASGTKQSNEAKMGAYPLENERQILADGFKDYFYHLGFAVNQQLQNKGV